MTIYTVSIQEIIAAIERRKIKEREKRGMIKYLHVIKVYDDYLEAFKAKESKGGDILTVNVENPSCPTKAKPNKRNSLSSKKKVNSRKVQRKSGRKKRLT